MKCPSCSVVNLEGSEFCQNCGNKLIASTTSEYKVEKRPKKLHEQIEELDDVIFKPKKKRSAVVKTLLALVGLGLLGFGGLLFLAYLYPEKAPVEEPPVESTVFPAYQIVVDELGAEWVGQTFHLKGILKNNYSQSAGNVKVRVDFFKDEEMTQLFDTRYVTITSVSANGAYSFNEPVYIENPTAELFWYTAQVQEAEYLR